MSNIQADLLEVAEVHVRMIKQKAGLSVMTAEARAALTEVGKLGGEFMKKLKALPGPKGGEDFFEELAPHGMQLFMLLKAYEAAPAAILEALKRHIPELAPIYEELIAD